MLPVLTRRGLAVCLVVAVSACASSRDERAASPTTMATLMSAQSAEQSDCGALSRFSRMTFIAADRNHDGVIDEAEYAGDVVAAFAGEDANLDNQLSRSELPDAPSGTFDRLNSSHSGALTVKELMQAKMAEFQRADTNGDGVLSIDEVTRFNAQQGGC